MAVDLTNTETEVFGGAVYMAYIHGDMFGTTGMQFYGVRPTEVVNVPVVRAGQAVFLDDGGDHTAENSSMTGVQVPLFKPIKSSNIIKQSQVDTRPDLSLLENLGKQHGRNVARMKTITILQMLAKASDSAGNDVISGGWAGADAASIKNGIKDVAAAMDLAGVPAEGRHGMMKSDLWYELVDQEGVIRKDFGGKGNVQTAGGNGAVINYLNFDIKNCGVGFGTNWPALGTAASLDIPDSIEKDLTKVFAVFWHEDAWALRHQTSLQVVTPFIDHKQSWLVLARLHMGCAEVYTDPSIPDSGTTVGLNSREGIYAFENS